MDNQHYNAVNHEEKEILSQYSAPYKKEGRRLEFVTDDDLLPDPPYRKSRRIEYVDSENNS